MNRYAQLLAAIAVETDDCIAWSHAPNPAGYGRLTLHGRTHRVAPLVCELTHGPKPPEREAAHSCGHRDCINPRHIRWATHAENMADIVTHGRSTRGERHHANCLTEDDVWQIRRLAGTVTQAVLAERYSVRRNTISQIVTRKTWSWLIDDLAASAA